jgi:hypothetical protein
MYLLRHALLQLVLPGCGSPFILLFTAISQAFPWIQKRLPYRTIQQ